MKKIEILCRELETGMGGIATFTDRMVNAINDTKKMKARGRIWDISDEADMAVIQYEPGMISPETIISFAKIYTKNPIILMVHHSGGIEKLFDSVDGAIFFSELQIPEEWKDISTVIEHPALVFKNKSKKSMRKKFKLPKDKTIIGTAGFIYGTNKRLELIAEPLLKNLADNEFLYFITSFWKGGDGGKEQMLYNLAKKYGKEEQIRIDSDFIDDKTLNEKMQACDLLWAWNIYPENYTFCTSGIAADMYGARRPLIVKNSGHYYNIAKKENVYRGSSNPEEFADQVLILARKKDELRVPENVEEISWKNMSEKYIDFFNKFL